MVTLREFIVKAGWLLPDTQAGNVENTGLL